jgi:hypothetical protein
MVEEGRSPAERVITRDLGREEGVGRPLSTRARQTIRTVESYLKGGDPPRWMARLREIDRGIVAERQRLARAYRALARECGHDAELFAHRWLALVRSWRFDHLNELIGQHNDWYPIERDLPMDPRTGDYVKIAGRSYRRAPLDHRWVLEQFPASPPPDAAR